MFTMYIKTYKCRVLLEIFEEEVAEVTESDKKLVILYYFQYFINIMIFLVQNEMIIYAQCHVNFYHHDKMINN